MPTRASGRRTRPRKLRLPLDLLTAPVSDMAVQVFTIVAQLDRGRRGCFARVEYLADRLGVVRETAQRALGELRPWVQRDEDGALRVVRKPGTGFVWLPCDLTERMTARHARAYAWVAYCNAVGRDVKPSELARKALTRKDGKSVSPDTAKRVLRDLEAAGWVSVTERRGKASLYEIHETIGKATPRKEVTAPPATGSQTQGNQVTETTGNTITSTRGSRVTQSRGKPERVNHEQPGADVVRNGAVGAGDDRDGFSSMSEEGRGAGSAGASPPAAEPPPRVLPFGETPVKEVLLPPGDSTGPGHDRFAETAERLRRRAEQARQARRAASG